MFQGSRSERVAVHPNHVLLVEWYSLANVNEFSETTLLDIGLHRVISFSSQEGFIGDGLLSFRRIGEYRRK